MTKKKGDLLAPNDPPIETSKPESGPKTEQSSVLRSAFKVASGTFVSRILGMFRDILIARYLGTDMRDAFINAFRLPNLFRRVFGEGSLSVSFVPRLIHTLHGRGPEDREVRELIAGVFAVLMSATVTLTLLAEVFMPEILHFLLSGASYMSVPGKFELTVQLGRVMFAFLILISAYSFFMAVLASLGRFALAALAPALFNAVMIIGAVQSQRFNFPANVLAWSVLLGGFVQMLVLVPSVVAAGFFPRLRLVRLSPEVKQVLLAFLPGAFSLSVLQLSAIVNMRFAAELESGTHSYLYLADRILELPVSLVAVSLGTVLLPTLAGHWANGQTSRISEAINHALRMAFFISIPAAVGMAMLAKPIAQILFMGKEFTYFNAMITASVIRIFSLSVLLAVPIRILAQGFYAAHRAWFPALAAAIALLVQALFAAVLIRNFGIEGLASASVIGLFFNAALLGGVFNARLAKIHLRNLLIFSLKLSIGAGFVAAVTTAYGPLSHYCVGRVPAARTLSLVAVIVVAATGYFVIAAAMKLEEWRELSRPFVERLRRLFFE